MTRRTVFRPAPLFLAIALALSLPAVQAQGVADAALGAPLQINITTQPLGQALNDWARQTRVELIVPPALVAGKTAAGVSGLMTPRHALDRLLAGSGLIVAMEGAVVVVKAAPAPASSALPPVIVTAAVVRDTAIGPLQGLVARRSATATKTSTPLIETPQSISVVGAEEMESLKAQSLMDALGYVAGVMRVEGVDRTTESLIIRGFEAWADNGSLYRDGIKYGVNINNGTQEPYGLERIELLKGASSVLYGAAAPGGIINTISKRPSIQPLRELNLEAGSFNRQQVSGDFGGAVNNDGDWSYRLTFLARQSDTFVDHVPDDRTYIAPALKWQPSANTSLTLLSEYQHDRTAYVYALPPEGTVLPNVNGRIPRNRFMGEPGFDKYDNARWSVGYLLEHAFSEQLTLRNSLRYYEQSNQRPFVYYTDGLTADQRSTVTRAAVEAADDSNAVTTDTSLEYKWTWGSVAHTSLVGLDYTYQKHQQVTSSGSAAPLDLFTPIYGLPIGAMNYIGTRKFRDHKAGLYAQNQMKIDDRWVVLIGGRQDWSKNDTKPATGDWLYQQYDAFSARAGLVYLAENGLAPFVSFSQSFEPTTGLDRLGERFKPSRGEQYEAGLRYQPQGSSTLLSAAVYQLTKSNVSVTDPLNQDFSIQQGKVRSQGLELEARARIARRLNLIAAYAYTDAQTVKSSPVTPELDGTRTAAVPHHQFSLWSDLDLGGLGLSGFKVGAGVRQIGATIDSSMIAVVPEFTLLDAMVSYTSGAWRFALNATNLADKTYVASCTYGCFYGEPRKLIGTVTLRW